MFLSAILTLILTAPIHCSDVRKKIQLIYILDDLRMRSFSENVHLWVIYFFKIFMDYSICGIRAKNIPWYFSFGGYLWGFLPAVVSLQRSQQNHNPLLSVEVNLVKSCMENLSHTWELLHIHFSSNQPGWKSSASDLPSAINKLK